MREPDVRAVVDSILQARRGCAHLRSLDLSRIVQHGGLDILSLILDALPQFQHIAISGNFDALRIPEEWPVAENPVHSSRTITLKRLNGMHRTVLCDLLGLLTKEFNGHIVPIEAFPQFEKILIVQCPCISAEGVEDEETLGVYGRKRDFLDWVC